MQSTSPEKKETANGNENHHVQLKRPAETIMSETKKSKTSEQLVDDDLEAQLECIVEGKPPKAPPTTTTQNDDSVILLDDDTTLENEVDDVRGALNTEDATAPKVVETVEVKETPAKETKQDVAKEENKEPISGEEKLVLPAEKKTDEGEEKVALDTSSTDKHITKTRISEMILNNGSSTPNSNNATSVNFTGTPIPVSTLNSKLMISSPEVDDTPTPDVSITEEQTDLKISTEKIETTSDEDMKQFKAKIKQLNGTSDSADSVEEKKIVPEIMDERKKPEPVAIDFLKAPVPVVLPEETVYETNVHFEGDFLQLLVVERVDKQGGGETSDIAAASSEKSSSNGSALSLGPFQLPAISRTATELSSSSSSSGLKLGSIPLDQPKKIVKGANGLRAFLEDLLKRIPEEEIKAKKGAGRGRAKVAKSAGTTEVKKEDQKDKSEVNEQKKSDGDKVGSCVLARWTDKKYYAGRITGEKPGNKYVVHFEDGANKTLPADHIVFGDKDLLPLLDQEVNVLVEKNIYEAGLVVAINPENCTYNVVTDTRNVFATATDLYLDEDQAKVVQLKEGVQEAAGDSSSVGSNRRKRSAAEPLNTSAEAGCSSQLENNKKSRKR